MNEKLLSWYFLNSGGAFTPSAEYQLVLDRATTLTVNAPSEDVQQLQDTMMIAIRDSLGLSNISYWYVLADDADNKTFSYINWKAPSTFNCSEVGTPVKTNNQGIAGGTGIALNTGWDVSTNGGSVSTQNDDGIAIWCYDDSTTPGSSMGANTTATGNRTAIQLRDASEDILWRLNATGAFLTFATTVGASNGLTMMLRRSSSDVKFIKNSTELGTATNGTTGVCTLDDYLLAENNNGSVANPSSLKHSIFMRGNGNAMYTNRAAIYNAFNTYMTALAAL